MPESNRQIVAASEDEPNSVQSSSSPASLLQAQLIPLAALCKGCGYSLYKLTNPRCPECGLRFDPNDPTTWRLSNSSRFREFCLHALGALGAPPGLAELSAVVIATGLVVWKVSQLGHRDDDVAQESILPVFIYLMGIIVFRAVLQVMAQAAETMVNGAKRSNWRRVVTPLCALALALCFIKRTIPVEFELICLNHGNQLQKFAKTVTQDNRPQMRKVGNLGMVRAFPLPGNRVRLLVDLDYYDRWSTCLVALTYDPNRSAPAGYLRCVQRDFCWRYEDWRHPVDVPDH